LNVGSQTFPNAVFGWINVKDVANAHINAYEDASASGRYCLAERVMHFSELTKILSNIIPNITNSRQVSFIIQLINFLNIPKKKYTDK
jgi:hypothetical protein